MRLLFESNENLPWSAWIPHPAPPGFFPKKMMETSQEHGHARKPCVHDVHINIYVDVDL